MAQSNFKTPRTLITEYLETSKTQTTKPTRSRERVLRTPDVENRSPWRHIQHDRVSSLRGKRTRSLSSLTDEFTPRQLIEGYLAGEDSAAPVIRRTKRTSQATYSASQPVGSPRRRSNLPLSRSFTNTDPDVESPRTLIQNYLKNATNVIDTPVVVAAQPSPLSPPHSQSVPGSEQYDTPSPFKSSSQSSQSSIKGSARKRSHRKNAGKFHLSVEKEKSASWESTSPIDNLVLESPTNRSYVVPSPFRSSPESVTGSYLSQNTRALETKTRRHTKGNFNITVPAEMLDRSGGVLVGETVQHDNEEPYDDEFEDELVIPETQQSKIHDDHEQHIIYELPMKPVDEQFIDHQHPDHEHEQFIDHQHSDNVHQHEQFMDQQHPDHVHQHEQFMDQQHPDHVYQHEQFMGHQHRDPVHQHEQFMDHQHLDHVHQHPSDVDEHDMDIDNHDISPNDIEKNRRYSRVNHEHEQQEIEMTLRQSHTKSERSSFQGEQIRRSGDMYVKDGRNIQESENREFDEMYERYRARDRRYSEGYETGHRKASRYSDGRLGYNQRSPGDHQQLNYLGNDPLHPGHPDGSPMNQKPERSNDLVPSVRRSRTPTEKSFEQIFGYQEEFSQRARQQGRDSSGDAYTDTRSEGKHLEEDVDMYDEGEGQGEGRYITHVEETRDNMAAANSAYLHSIPDNTAGFSPRTSSTQRIHAITDPRAEAPTPGQPREKHSFNNSLGNFSPRISSTQKGHTVDDAGTTVIARNQQGYIQTVPDQTVNFSPRITSTQRMYTTIGNQADESPLDTVTPSPVVSPQRNSMSPSLVLTPGSSSRRVAAPHREDRSSSVTPSSSVRRSSRVRSSSDRDVVSTKRDSSSSLTPRSSSRRGVSTSLTPVSGSSRENRAAVEMEENSPLDTVTPSPVVSPQRDSLSSIRTPETTQQRARTLESRRIQESVKIERMTSGSVRTPDSVRNETITSGSGRTPGSFRNETMASGSGRAQGSGRKEGMISVSSRTQGSVRKEGMTSGSVRTPGSVRNETMTSGSDRTPGSVRNEIMTSGSVRTLGSVRNETMTSEFSRTPGSVRKEVMTSGSGRTTGSVRKGVRTPVSSGQKGLALVSGSRSRKSPNTGNNTSQSLVSGKAEKFREKAKLIHTLPNTTADFSPKISSTQNFTTRPGSDENETESQDDLAEAEDDVDNDMDREDDGVDEVDEGQSEEIGATVLEKKTKTRRRHQQKPQYSLPVSAVKKTFSHFAGMRVSKEAVDEVMKVSEVYWDNVAASLEAFAHHAGRKRIDMSDFVLLFKRQRLINEKESFFSLIEKYLPMEEREKLIPVARAYNRIEPKV